LTEKGEDGASPLNWSGGPNCPPNLHHRTQDRGGSLIKGAFEGVLPLEATKN
jgi:hypothetical protein